ncbi:class C sortase [Bifidobacterium aesculapii]|uniref:class C sortase n=1 Tax=Bifidobacterium aesculapii TaxID=1329411 RepID=UPI0006E272CE|nr:class C sortase [Bifidobacterium aesculapii]
MTIIAHLISVLMVLAGIGIIGIPFIGCCRTSLAHAQTIATARQTVASWPKSHRDLLLDSARDYNKRLAASGQHVLGEVADPFADGNDKTTTTDDGDNSSQSSIEYQSLLDMGDGLMGEIRIPKIGVAMPIMHGTSAKTLEQGAGHLYGTSLPIGGVSTHAVITGHRGLVSALMFTRLDEIHAGDSFYIGVMGKEFGYRVDRISVIEPDDDSLLRMEPGEDRVTLMTCTPYGVNTHRLLVSGVRAHHRRHSPILR